MSETPPAEPEQARLRVGGTLGRTVQAGLDGEAVSAGGVLAAIGGVRGVVESLLPGLLFLVVYVFTQDATLSVIAPAALAVIAVLVRLVSGQPVVSALSGALGVGVCIAATLWTGSGRDYFLPGFLINTGWIAALLISVLVGWPLLGLVMGALRGDLTGWRRIRLLKRAATLTSLLWLTLFVARLAVQVPLYLADQVEALGVARLVMGVPLFALVVLFTWLILSRTSQSSDDDARESVENTGENPQA
ncbi:DUF3159 domain-containing protein [Leucobacter sp. GX24907]